MVCECADCCARNEYFLKSCAPFGERCHDVVTICRHQAFLNGLFAVRTLISQDRLGTNTKRNHEKEDRFTYPNGAEQINLRSPEAVVAAGIEKASGVWVAAATQHGGVQSAADVGAQRTHRSVRVSCRDRSVNLPEVSSQACLGNSIFFIRKWFQKAEIFSYRAPGSSRSETHRTATAGQTAAHECKATRAPRTCSPPSTRCLHCSVWQQCSPGSSHLCC